MPDDGPVREVGIDFGKFPAGDDYRIAVIGGPQDGIQQRFGPDGLSLRQVAKADNPRISAPEIRQHFCPLGLVRRSPFAVNSDQRRAQFFRDDGDLALERYDPDR